MEEWIIFIIEKYGYFGVFFIMVIENLFPPIPSEIVLPFSGFMTTKTNLSFTGMIVTSTMGSITGALVLYWIGNKLSAEKLEQIIEKWGRVLRLKKEDVRKADRWFLRYGVWTVFFGRMIPLIRSLISIPAGMSKMRLNTFLLFTSLGTLIWNSILISIGMRLGESWHDILNVMSLYSNLIYLGLGILILLGIIYFTRRK
ncbi:DedA family protein [Aquibacillus halophilus]|uniref:DedA family protein n=1 Tax=Aquibacillus halophilus TaxID=930132 RepID=A0A6A8DMY5_9BACI|nr:DedA family protein [Aquibacillus halophilus]